MTLSIEERQALARFAVGQTENASSNATLNYAGQISYNQVTGVPTSIHPAYVNGMETNSGYSVGNIQWDFGQRPSSVPDLVSDFEDWAKSVGLNPNQYDSQQHIITGLQSNGAELKANASLGLNDATLECLIQNKGRK